MFEPRDKGGKAGDRSPLSLDRALREERDRHGASEHLLQVADNDLLARHRLARARREAHRKAHESAGQPWPAQHSSEDAQWRGHALDERSAETASWEGEPGRPAEWRHEPHQWPGQFESPEIAEQGDPQHRGAAASRPDRWTEPEPGAEMQDQLLFEPRIVLGGIARSKALIASTALAGALIGLVVGLGSPQTYRASSEVLVAPRAGMERSGAQALPSEAMLAINGRILTSEPVLAGVVEKLNLTNDPEFNGAGASQLASLLNPLDFVRSLLSRADGPDDAQQANGAAAVLASKVSVQPTDKPFILNVDVATGDARKSVLVADALVSEYVRYSQQPRSAAAGSELAGRLSELRRDVEAAEQKIATFKAQYDIVDLQGRSIEDDDLIKLNERLSAARANTLELDARASSVRKLSVNSIVDGALPEGVNSAALAGLRAQYAEVKQSFDNATTRLGPRHPQLQALEAQLAGARDQLSAELRRIISSMQVDLKRAVELEQELAARLAQLKVRRGDTGQHLVQLRELERDAEAKRALYDSALGAARATDGPGNAAADVSVIRSASAPLSATGSSPVSTTGFGALLGLLAGLGLAGLRGAYDSVRLSGATGRRRWADPAPSHASAPAETGPGSPVARDVLHPPGSASGPETSIQNAQEADMHAQYAPYPEQDYAPQAAPSYPSAGPQPPAQPGPLHGYQQSPHQPAYAPQPQPHYAAGTPLGHWQQPAPQPAWQAPPHGQAWAGPYAHSAPPAYPQSAYPQPQYPYPPQPHPAGAAQPAPPESLSTAESINALWATIDEIRASVRECRDAMLQLVEKRNRRYF